MKKILLIYPKTGVQVLKPQSPLSLLAICPGLIEAGFEPILVDMRLEGSKPMETIKQHIQDALFVGISTMTGHQIHHALDTAQMVRTMRPNTTLVWGGIHPSLLPEETLRHSLVDIVVVGEGEQTVVELAQCLAEGGDLSSVRGLAYKTKDGGMVTTSKRPLLDLTTLSTPSWHLVDVSAYSEIGVQTGRGCPWRCRFCYNIRFNDRRWRAKNTNQIVEELKLLKEVYKVKHVTFYDDNFFSNPKRVRALAECLIKEKIDIRWSTTCRADYLSHYDTEFINLLKQSGVHILFVGSESGSSRILKYIDKDITTEDILGMARATNSHSLRVHTSFMVGFPGENDADRRMTFDMMDKIKSIDPNIYITTTCIYTPYPGNEMFDDAVRAGFIPPKSLEEWANFSFFECQLPWLSKKNRKRMERLAFISRFVFWHREIKARYLTWYYYPFYYFLRANALLRWRFRFFDLGLEWDIFSKFVGAISE